MPTRVKAASSEAELMAFMDSHGLTPLSVGGPIVNSSGHLVIFYEDDSDEQIGIDGQVIEAGQPGTAGVSYGTGSGTIVVTSKRTVVTGESVGAISGQEVSGTLANTYVMPGTVELTDTGGAGPTIKDNGLGVLHPAGQPQKRIGKIVYSTGALEFTYPANSTGSGTLEADYEHSDQPGTSIVPSLCKLSQIAIEAAGNVGIEIYADSDTNVLVFAGTVTVTGGVGYLDLGGAIFRHMDLDKSDTGKMWVVVDAAVTNMWVYWERAD